MNAEIETMLLNMQAAEEHTNALTELKKLYKILEDNYSQLDRKFEEQDELMAELNNELEDCRRSKARIVEANRKLSLLNSGYVNDINSLIQENERLFRKEEKANKRLNKLKLYVAAYQIGKEEKNVE